MDKNQDKIEDPLAGLEVASELPKKEAIKKQPEILEIPDLVPEQKQEVKTEALPADQEFKKGKKEEPPISVPAKPIKTQPVVAKGVYFKQIESVLETGLAEVYSKMPPEKQKEFRKAGEETATKISQLLGAAKIKTQKIFELIINWLKIIPGVNRFFLEQEAKIKADRILGLKNRK